ncbi:MAG: pyruvate ferredoxin oxidoreductase [Desulfobacterales bacterium]|nr:pyruvate ferredoxin oxidoreductase [Desulfobacterales bacterium]
MDAFNIYVTGVGGQGVGLLSEILLRAADHAGLPVKAVDTHGLAQRGGVVASQLRIGERVFTPLIPGGEADVVAALERHEALRGLDAALKDRGALIYYNTVWQPLPVRLGQAAETTGEMIRRRCEARGVKEIVMFDPDLEDPLMQNMVVLAGIDGAALIPGVETRHYEAAMEDLMRGEKLEKNRRIFFKNRE